MELKGILQKGSQVSVNCCEQIQDLLIDGVSLYDELEKLFSPDLDTHYDKEDKRELRYIVLDETPSKDVSFNDAFADATMKMLYAEHAGVCYSEYTCGDGGFDYVVSDSRSLFVELEEHVGKYIHLKI